MKIFVLALFILTYVCIIAMPKLKVYVAGGTAVISLGALIIFGYATISESLLSVDYNVLLMLVGMMITVGLFSESGMPNKIADKLMSKIPSALVAVVLLAVLSGFISAFIDNVATVLMLAPIGLAVAKKAEISPIPVIISIAVSSNLQGAATLVGDTTSIMLGSFADMSFFDFFFLDGKLSIFWAVELGAFLTIPVLLIYFRKDNKPISIKEENIKIISYMPTVLLLTNILLLIVFSFLPDKIDLTNGLTCIIIGIIGLAYNCIRFKASPVGAFKMIDFETVLFLFFLFTLIFTVERVGIIDDIGSAFTEIGDKNLFLLYTIVVFGSVVLSAFIDNIPYVATMLPVIASLSLSYNARILLYFGLLCGATLGGNLTPVGASANIVGIGILRKEGYDVKTKDFLKIGIPFTLVAVLGGYLLTWLVWGI